MVIQRAVLRCQSVLCCAGFCFGCGELQLRHQSRCPKSEAVPLPSTAPELSSAQNRWIFTPPRVLSTPEAALHLCYHFVATIKWSDKSPVGQDGFPLVHLWRPLSIMVKKSQRQELGPTCHFTSTVKNQRETDACSYHKVSILHSPGSQLAQGIVPPPVGGSSHFYNLVKIGPL